MKNLCLSAILILYAIFYYGCAEGDDCFSFECDREPDDPPFCPGKSSSWTQITDSIAATTDPHYEIYNDLYFINSTIGIVAGTRGIYRSTTAGVQWYKTTGVDTVINEIDFADDHIGMAAGLTVFKTTDGGHTWAPTGFTDTYPYGSSICMIDALNAWASFGPSLYNTMDGGVTWTKINPIEQLGWTIWHDISFVNANEGFVMGEGGVGHTMDGGESWELYLYGNPDHLNHVVAFAPGMALAFGYENVFLTTDGGKNWVRAWQAAENHWVSIDDAFFPNTSVGTMVGGNGALLKTTDGGRTWNCQPSNSRHYLAATYFLHPDTGYAMSALFGEIIMTTNGGGP